MVLLGFPCPTGCTKSSKAAHRAASCSIVNGQGQEQEQAIAEPNPKRNYYSLLQQLEQEQVEEEQFDLEFYTVVIITIKY